ncbi:MAG: hypothetical protein R3C44_00985 [Chloroflexota bacterium]
MAEGNVVVTDGEGQVIVRARQEPDGEVIYMDADGNRLEDPPVTIEFDANGEPHLSAGGR